ncbi:hypothetical protein KCP75_11680 [Salmonella enterica subsp. enterica]|nr:hypothetical protein KCP75_11680 [Salmonella enterica subsp. enterica]
MDSIARLGGTLETKRWSWGYDYYVFDKGHLSGINHDVACLKVKNQKIRHRGWVRRDAALQQRSCRSWCTCPANVDVKYRIWKADANVRAVTRCHAAGHLPGI